MISDSFWKILGEWLRTADSKKAATVQWMYCSGGTKQIVDYTKFQYAFTFWISTKFQGTL